MWSSSPLSPLAFARLVGGTTLLQQATALPMPDPSLADLFATPTVDARTASHVPVRGICVDSRRLTPGQLFFALPGATVHGKDFIAQAVERGACAVVAPEAVETSTHAPVIKVADIQATLIETLRRYYRNPQEDLALTGLAGTSGKTVVAHLLRHLKGNADRAGLIGTNHYAIGERTLPAYRTTPEAVELYSLLSQMRETGCDEAILEVSSHALAQGRVADLNFQTAAFLNLTPEHLDYHGDMTAYFETVARLFDGRNGVPPSRVLLNADDAYSAKLRARLPANTEVLTFGQSGEVRADNVQLHPEGAIFDLTTPWEHARVRVPMLGQFNIENALAAIALAMWSGTPFPAVAERLANFGGVRGRMERVAVEQPFQVVVDYAHTPAAYGKALQMLRDCTAGRVITVFGCGGDRDPRKRPEITRLVAEHADLAFATADNPRSETVEAIFADMRTGLRPRDPVHFIHDRRQAIGYALAAAQPGDTVLIVGKGHETFQEWADTVTPFDDRAVVREWLTPTLPEAP